MVVAFDLRGTSLVKRKTEKKVIPWDPTAARFQKRKRVDIGISQDPELPIYSNHQGLHAVNLAGIITFIINHLVI